MKLFDMLVTPIVTYGNNIWAPTLVKKFNTSFKNVCDSPAFEKLNIKLCKYILCTGKYSVNDVVRGELGRFLFMISILAHSFKYFKRLEDMPEGSLLKLSHLDILQPPHLYNNSSWYNCIVELASRSHCSKYVPASQNRKLMKMRYKDLWSQSIQGNNKLRSYVKFKHEFKLENYILHESHENRRNLARLRTSSHKLTVETGRYNKVALKDRLCQLCDCNTIENEYHFVMPCPLYNELRVELMQSLDNFTCISTYDPKDIFLTLMSCNNGDHEFVIFFFKYINQGLQLRSTVSTMPIFIVCTYVPLYIFVIFEQ